MLLKNAFVFSQSEAHDFFLYIIIALVYNNAS